MSVRIVVVEDESIVLKDITSSLGKLGYEVVGTASTGEKAIEIIKELNPDLVLLDIMLKGDLSGIDVSRFVSSELEIPVVFLTAYADSATFKDAKITDPYGYILKPFKEVDLHNTIEMALHKFKTIHTKIDNEVKKAVYSIESSTDDWVFVKNNSRLLKVNYDDFFYVEALKDYVILHTKAGKFTIHSTMKQIDSKLSPKYFVRLHRSYIINISKVVTVAQGFVHLQLDDASKSIKLPVGGNYRDGLYKRLHLV